jgi:Tautomerase enzyme
VPFGNGEVSSETYVGTLLLEVAFISGRPRETRLALLKELNAQIVERTGISPDDLLIQLSEAPGGHNVGHTTKNSRETGRLSLDCPS